MEVVFGDARTKIEVLHFQVTGYLDVGVNFTPVANKRVRERVTEINRVKMIQGESEREIKRRESERREGK